MLKPYLAAIIAVLCLQAAAGQVDINPTEGRHFSFYGSFNLRFIATYQNDSLAYPNEFNYCTFRLYNGSNNALIQFYNLSKGASSFSTDDLNSSITAQQGTYPYVVNCETNSTAGFLSSSFVVNNDGVDHSKENPFALGILAVLPLLFGIILLFCCLTLDSVHNVLRIFLLLLALFTVEVSLFFAAKTIGTFYIAPEVMEAIGLVTFVYGMLYVVILAYWLLYAIIKIVETAAKSRQERMEY